MRMNGYGKWAVAALGLLGVTFGLTQVMRGKRNAPVAGVASMVAPTAVRGLVGRTLSRLGAPRR